MDDPEHVIAGKAFLDALYKAGIVPDNVERVVIDGDYGGLVRVYYAQHGDARLLEYHVIRGLMGIVARRVTQTEQTDMPEKLRVNDDPAD